MRFISDSMLGKLTRWLRIAGCDVIYVNDFPSSMNNQDEYLLERARDDHRILLTQDLDLYRKAIKSGIKSIYLDSNDLVNQLIDISKHCSESINFDFNYSRCPVCNGELDRVSPAEVSERVSEDILERYYEFLTCIECHKVYWPGSHWENITRTAERYKSKLR